MRKQLGRLLSWKIYESRSKEAYPFQEQLSNVYKPRVDDPKQIAIHAVSLISLQGISHTSSDALHKIIVSYTSVFPKSTLPDFILPNT